MKKLLIILLAFISLPAFADYERVKPTYLAPNVKTYGDPHDNLFFGSDYKYEIKNYSYGFLKPQYYESRVLIEERVCEYVDHTGVYRDYNCREKDGRSYTSYKGWFVDGSKKYIVEYDIVQLWNPILLNLYALDNNGNVIKYEAVKTPQKNKLKQYFLGNDISFQKVSTYKQTKTIDKNKIAEITEYDNANNILHKYERSYETTIKEYNSSGKLTGTHNGYSYSILPFLKWKEWESEAKNILKEFNEKDLILPL